MNHIVTESNRYATSLGNDLNLTVPELEVFLGINIMMTYIKYPNTRLYWSSVPSLRMNSIADSMSVNRFEEIRRYIHFNDNESVPPNNKDKLIKIRPILDALHEAYHNAKIPGEFQAVDEMVCPFKGKSSLKQYLRNKPNKWGFKIWVLADMTGYVSCFEVYQGAAKSNSQADEQAEKESATDKASTSNQPGTSSSNSHDQGMASTSNQQEASTSNQQGDSTQNQQEAPTSNQQGDSTQNQQEASASNQQDGSTFISHIEDTATTSHQPDRSTSEQGGNSRLDSEHSNLNPEASTNSTQRSLGPVGDMVLRLCHGIQFHNHKLFMDNFFITLSLISELEKVGIYSLGTLQINRVPSVKDYLTDTDELKQQGRGAFSFATSEDNMTIVRWMDSGAVHLASNFVGVEPVDTVKRFDKKVKRYVTVTRPAVVALYNKYMGGVDLTDRMIAHYPHNAKNKRWYLRLFFHFLNVTIINCWILFKRARDPKYPLLNFKADLAEELISHGVNLMNTKCCKVKNNKIHTRTLVIVHQE
jgi:hypothetical protein